MEFFLIKSTNLEISAAADSCGAPNGPDAARNRQRKPGGKDAKSGNERPAQHFSYCFGARIRRWTRDVDYGGQTESDPRTHLGFALSRPGCGHAALYSRPIF